ncbi:hypothetical protein NC651_033333 [Populus alba x Populus x berolinensis]|nr:hypothetical protein NC651_033333 [Populus alba x Populus x berolinensis]
MEIASKFVKESVENKKVCFKVIRGRISRIRKEFFFSFCF